MIEDEDFSKDASLTFSTYFETFRERVNQNQHSAFGPVHNSFIWTRPQFVSQIIATRSSQFFEEFNKTKVKKQKQRIIWYPAGRVDS